ncbi:U3 small nucleolar ribonucleoprotein complex, subunit Mpp10, partial [Vararia minispora EC-137]
TMDGSDDAQLISELQGLATLLEERSQSLATGSQDISAAALTATRYLFDLAVFSEEQSQPHIDRLLASFSPAEAPQTRSQSRASGKRKRDASPAPSKHTFERTPVSSLFIAGLNGDQIWAQLELRTNHIWHTLHLALDGTGEGSIIDPVEPNLSADGEVNNAIEAFTGLDGDDEEDASEWEDEDSEELDDEESEDDGMSSDLDETVADLRDASNEVDGEGGEKDVNPEASPPASTRSARRLRRVHGHPDLDDGFFELAAFNAEIEEAEVKSVTKGSLGRDSDEEADEGDDIDFYADFDALETSYGDAAEAANYQDFFAPPRMPGRLKHKRPTEPARTRVSKVRFNEEVRVRKIKARGKNLPLSAMDEVEDEDSDDDGDFEAEDEDEDGDEDAGTSFGEDKDADYSNENIESLEDTDIPDGLSEGSEEFSGRDTMDRLQTDLFADDEEQEDDDLSTYEKRQAALREQITALEEENTARKGWTLLGEASSRSRPINSLLEEDLEFERVMKAVPVMTQDVVQGLEDRIKARILEGRFDDVIRRRAPDEKPFLPSRFFELQDTKSKQSLAQIYEDEYTATQAGISIDDRDGKLAKEHDELEKLWERISHKLDSLSNTHFTPKAPKAAITTVTNVASASMESALPTAKSAATMLAPEEVYHSSSADIRSRSELTPAEKRSLHNKQKKARRKARDALESGVDKFARLKGRKSVKAEKEEALKSMVKHGKGVTVVGKTSQDAKRGRSKK